ncbi:MAG: hypothetical protein H6Q37_1305 [Chloroflexi bacterium]|nr:hypothetical protein [Chloroflexota bacterium]
MNETIICPQCRKKFIERDGQDCAGCEQRFCLDCVAQFETCELCGRSFCPICAQDYIQIPAAKTICNDCYAVYVEDTDFLFD